jgi:peptide/nickel transport system substrate-binding protein
LPGCGPHSLNVIRLSSGSIRSLHEEVNALAISALRRAAVVAVALFSLAACAGGTSGSTGPAASSGATGDPVQGGSATILVVSEPRTLDPAQGSNNATGGITGNAIFGSLLDSDPATDEIKPSLATGLDSTDGGATFTLALRDGLVFSDGTPLDAAAVKVNWDRLRDPATGSTYLSDASLVASTEVVDPTHLKVVMASPIPNFSYSVITTSLNWIASPAALAQGKEAFDKNPVGAGPYVLKEWRRQDAMELTRNPKYWDAPKPYLDSLTLRPALDGNQRLNTVTSGGADLAVETSWLNLKKAEQAGLPALTQALSGGTYMALNTRRAPFDDPRAREAVALAIDPQAVNVAAYQGSAQLVDTVFAKTSPLYVDRPAATLDKAKAQQLFDQLAAEGKPVSFTFVSSNSTESRSAAESVQAQLSAFKNVSVQISIVEFAAIAALQQSHDFDTTISSAAFLDPDPRLWITFNGQSRVNMSGINDPELNAALEKGRTATDVADRKAAYEVVQDRLEATHPLVWMNRYAGGVISQKTVGGLRLYGFASLRPEELWVKR